MLDNYNVIELLTDFKDIDLVINEIINDITIKTQINNNINGVKIA